MLQPCLLEGIPWEHLASLLTLCRWRHIAECRMMPQDR